MLFSWIRKYHYLRGVHPYPYFSPGFCIDVWISGLLQRIICVSPLSSDHCPTRKLLTPRSGMEARSALRCLSWLWHLHLGDNTQLSLVRFSQYWAVISQLPDNRLTCFWRHPRRFLSDGRICSTRIWTVASRGHSLLRHHIISHYT